ncbi:MAG: ACP S-malonyltransferase [Bacteroidales bacterium]|jgi:[acyl-carrier-protein] S-malonyltransferase|nr:ACP S-malonyltransferase [Bacteroidales bacterium]MDI9574823.1 ACP S-malonyltransferase [Bacteroidota bacterium]MDD3755472.1 ACP S-malonyltransferase [Bacteroidales bacterium]MDY0400801.1 ACP S-malonyltransferase [Bacteroidales bacterium]HHW59171.1 ACP S-malonyltransferase [Bacteroidales bacterium]
MKKAYVFPGQGAQYPGMGKDLFDHFPIAKEMMDRANEILGFNIIKLMFEGSEQDLMQTKVTQPAIFIHSVVLANVLAERFDPHMVAGHSLGEFSALVAAESMSYEDGLKLVYARAIAMQKACEQQPSTMAAVIGLDDKKVEEVLSTIKDEIVVPANYNTVGQIVISGTLKGIEIAMEKLKEAGAKRVLPLKVGGAFHSPLMEQARAELATAIDKTPIKIPRCPIYQNVTAMPTTDPNEIKKNLIDQLTSPVKWTQTIKNMINDGATEFIEVGPGNVLQGLIKKISSDVNAYSATI